MHVVLIVCQRYLLFAPTREAPGTNIPDIAERVRITSEDGIELEAWWVGTPTAPSLEMTLLYCHGNGATLGQLADVARIFQTLGLRALLFDYRSYGASDLAPLSEKALARDARAAFDWIVREKEVSPREIVVWGHSLGAAVASRLAIEREPAALIIEGAFTSLYAMARLRYPWIVLRPSFLFDSFATAEHLRTRTMPLLMFHAELDTVIPRALGEEAFGAAALPKQWIVIPNIDHNDFPSVESRYRDTIRAFLSDARAISHRS